MTNYINGNLVINHMNQIYLKKNITNIIYDHLIYEYDIIRKNFPKLKILHLSDTHFENNEKLIEIYKVKKDYFKDIEFDLIIHTGDIIDKNLQSFSDEFKDFLKDLNSKYGKYFVFGNHDYSSGDIYGLDITMRSLGFENLTNSIKNINIDNKQIRLIGIDDVLLGNIDENVFHKVNPDENNILITHNIDALPKAYVNLFSLTFSGHLHGGELNLGIVNGIQVLKYIKRKYKNVHQQKCEFKFLSKNCLSFIHPGNYTHVYYKYGIKRLFIEKEGSVIINLNKL